MVSSTLFYSAILIMLAFHSWFSASWSQDGSCCSKGYMFTAGAQRRKVPLACRQNKEELPSGITVSFYQKKTSFLESPHMSFPRPLTGEDAWNNHNWLRPMILNFKNYLMSFLQKNPNNFYRLHLVQVELSPLPVVWAALLVTCFQRIDLDRLSK